MTFRLELDHDAIQDLERDDDLVEEAILAVANVILAIALSKVPRLTGAGAASLHAVVERDPDGRLVAYVTWGPAAFYLLFVELGTSRMPARPFLRPALDAAHV